MYSKKITQSLKNEIIGRHAMMRDKNDILHDGVIIGRLSEFPVFRTRDGSITIEISWQLAYRAVYEHVCIIG